MNDNYEKYLEGMIAQAKTGLSTAEQYHCDGMIEGFKWSLERYRKFKAEQSHKPEQGLVQEIEEWRSVWIPELPGFNPYANAELEQILSRHTANVDKDKEVEPKEDK